MPLSILPKRILMDLTKKRMAYKGKRIANPVNNQTIEFIATSKDSGGEQLEMLSSWEPYSLVPAAHYHPYQDEVFKVLEGELTLMLNGKMVLLHEGESVHIHDKAVHAMWNNSNVKTVVNWKVFPACKQNIFLKQLWVWQWTEKLLKMECRVFYSFSYWRRTTGTNSG